jgi:formylglycine-generating enzyme required for sulfatase activity
MRRTALDAARGPIAAIALAILGLAASGCDNPTNSTSSPEEPKSGDADLSSLVVSAGTLHPEFDPDTTAYAVDAANEAETITVTGAASDAKATLSANNGVPQAISVGATVVAIAVTAEDGTKKTYAVTINRAGASNSDLSSLTVSEGTLKPEFDPDITSYIVYVANATTAATVTGAASDDKATLSANNGVAQNLSVGENVVAITVTAQDGTTKDYTVAVRRLFSLLMSSVPAGSFQRDATPANVSFVGAFRMGATEITRAQFRLIMGHDPSAAGVSTGTDDPVQAVSWYQAIAFCNKLSLAENLYPVYEVEGVDFAALEYADIPTGYSPAWNAATASWFVPGYRLPTEMEWMWAAMGAPLGGTDTTGYGKPYSGINAGNIDSFAWYSGNSGGTTHRVGTTGMNELFIHDLSGNVREWVWDEYASYPWGSQTDYRGPYSTGARVCRGGSWAAPAGNCAVAYRESAFPDARFSDLGFRVARSGW